MTVPQHLKNLNMTKKLAKRKKKCKVSRRNPTVYSMLRNEKDPLEQMEKTGVYKIPFKDMQTNENKSYIGVTLRTIRKRVNEHKRAIQQAKLTTVLATEPYQNDIAINWNEIKRIKHVPNRTKLIITETLEILKRADKEKLINDQTNWKPSIAWKYAMVDSHC